MCMCTVDYPYTSPNHFSDTWSCWCNKPMQWKIRLNPHSTVPRVLHKCQIQFPLSYYYFTMRYLYIKSTYTWKWKIHADHTLCDMELSGITWVQYGMCLYCRVWEVESGKCYKMLPHPTFVYSAKFHPRVSKVIVTGSYDNTVRVWHIDGTEIQGMLICIWWLILICLLYISAGAFLHDRHGVCGHNAYDLFCLSDYGLYGLNRYDLYSHNGYTL